MKHKKSLFNIRTAPLVSIPLKLVQSIGTIQRHVASLLVAIAFLQAAAFAAPPTQVKDIAAGVTSSFPSLLTSVNGLLFFTVGSDLWRSDGTFAGTILLSQGVAPNSLVNNNGTLLFINDDNFAVAQLWKSDGTPAGTVFVKNISDSGHGTLTESEQMLSINGTVYLNGVDSNNGRELWKTDGTFNGTGIVQDINPGAVYVNPPDQFTNVQGTLYFTADDGVNAHGHAIWKSNGTASGTTLILYGASFQNLTNVNGTLFSSFDSGSANSYGGYLYKTTNGGSSLVHQFEPFSSPGNLVDVNGTLFFTTFSNSYGTELWKSDGTDSGTFMVADINSQINPNSGSNLSSDPNNLTNVNGTLFFSADNGLNGVELWKSNGTAAGTVMVKNINPAGSSNPSNLTSFNGMLYFVADDGVHGVELWQSDGTASGTILVQDIRPGISGSAPSNLINVNDTLFFTANDGSTGEELWKLSILSQVLSSGVPVTNISAAVGTKAYYKITVPAGATNLNISTSGGSGDADLYVNAGAVPSPSVYGYRSWLNGNAEAVTVSSPAEGDWYIMLNAYADFSGVTLVASFTITYSVTPSAGINGSIIPSTVQIVSGGGSVGFTATPASGYVVDQWLINGSAVQAGGSSYTKSNVAGNTTVQVTFKTYYAYWSAAHGVTGAGSGLTEDFDNDGVNNLFEMAFGTNPTAATGGSITLSGANITQRGLPTTWTQTIANGVDYRALFGRRKDYVAAGLTYTVQFSGDMVNWQNSTDTPTVIGGDSEIDAVTVPYPFFVNGHKARFFKVQVTSP